MASRSEERRTSPVVGVLGEIVLTGAPWRLTAQQLSLVSFLASMVEASRRELGEALWDGQRVSEGRLSNLLSETRRVVGKRHLPPAVDGRYRLVGIRTDLQLFQDLVSSSSDPSVMALTDALTMVRGVPFTAPGRRYWSWPTAVAGLTSSAEILVAETASILVAKSIERQDLATARWACEQGLRAVPLDDDLTSALADIYVAMGKPTVAARLLAGREEAVARLGLGSQRASVPLSHSPPSLVHRAS